MISKYTHCRRKTEAFTQYNTIPLVAPEWLYFWCYLGQVYLLNGLGLSVLSFLWYVFKVHMWWNPVPALTYSYRKPPRGCQTQCPHPTDKSLSTIHMLHMLTAYVLGRHLRINSGNGKEETSNLGSSPPSLLVPRRNLF